MSRMNSSKSLIAILAVIIAGASFTASAGAATLTFMNNSVETIWFSIGQVMADTTKRPIIYLRDHPNPGTIGPVTIDLPGVAGDCFWINAWDRDGPSPWSNRACLQAVPQAVPSAPTGADAK